MTEVIGHAPEEQVTSVTAGPPWQNSGRKEPHFTGRRTGLETARDLPKVTRKRQSWDARN